MTQIIWPNQFWRDLLPACNTDTDALRKARNDAAAEVFALSGTRPIVAVSGSGTPGKHKAEACLVGRLIAELGFNLINGGLDGVMFDVTQGFLAASAKLPGGSALGKAIRVIPSLPRRVQQANALSPSLAGAQCVFTGLESISHIGPDSRNHVLIATADAIICLPGQEGSKSEARLARQVYHKPVIAYGLANKDEQDWNKKTCDYHIARTENVEAWLRQVLGSDPRKG